MRQATLQDEYTGGAIIFVGLLLLVSMIIFIYVVASGIINIHGAIYVVLVPWLCLIAIAFVAGHDLYRGGKMVRMAQKFPRYK